MSVVIAVDSGGTFTDCVIVDQDGAISRAKAPSTPPRFEEGVIDAVAEASQRLGRRVGELLADTEIFVHGTTVATNILITRTGAKTALLTTRGHEDAILIGRTVQKVAGLSEAEIIDVARLSKADPLVPRQRIVGIDERVDRDGEIVVPLDTSRLGDVVDGLRAAGVQSIAISFLWSFLNPEHERRVKEALVAAAGGDSGNGATGEAGDARWFVTASSDLAPVMREYERTSTTVLNAYLMPGVHGYLDGMRQRLRDGGHRGAIAVMHSGGGVSSIDEARERGVALLSSGPAGGMLGTKALARRLDIDAVVATDVGGTSFDVGMVLDGEPTFADMPVFSKYPVAVPVIDVASIGAGGGSIAWIEGETGVLKVGPESAGATPGPVCYGRGGTRPTVTDANVALGAIDPDYFLGGRIRLDRERALESIREQIAVPLGWETEQAAAAIVEIATSQMADLIRKITVERGRDPAGLTVFAYGGAGGLHAGAFASTLGCRHVVIPRAAAVFSAFGIGMSDLKRIAVVSDPSHAPFDLERWRRRVEELEDSLAHELEEERLPTGDLELRRFVELQFRGQAHAVRVPLEQDDLERGDGGEGVIERFVELYEARYGRGSAYREAGVEATTFVVEGSAALPVPAPETFRKGNGDASRARRGERSVFLHAKGVAASTPIYETDRLQAGDRLQGPAVVEAEDSTVLVHPGQGLWVDELLNLRLEVAHDA